MILKEGDALRKKGSVEKLFLFKENLIKETLGSVKGKLKRKPWLSFIT